MAYSITNMPRISLIVRQTNIRNNTYEKIHGRKPDISTVAVYGSRCEALDPHPKGKLAPRTQSGIFLGFCRDSNAHLVYFPSTKPTKPVKSSKGQTR